LISSPSVLRWLDRLLAMDLDGDAWRNIEEDLGLAFEIPDHEVHRQAGTRGAGSGATNQQQQKEWREVHSMLQTVARNLSARAGEIEQGAGIAAHERIIEDSLLRHLNVSHMTSRPRPALQASFRPPCIAVDVKLGGITELDELSLEGPPVDAIVVGHYLGELPQG